MSDEERTHSEPEEKSEGKEEKNRDEKSGASDEGKEKDSGEKKEEKKSRAPSKKVLIIAGVVLVVLLVIGLLYYLHARNFESTDDAYTTGHIHEISARITGTILQVLVNDNQFVRQGEVLVVLDPSNYNLGFEKARAQKTQAEAQVVQARAQVAQHEAAADRASADLEKAQNDFQRVTSLYQQDVKAVSKSDVDTATAALHSAESEGAAAKADTAAAQAELSVAHAGVTAAETGVHDAELQLSYTKIVAPVAGVIGKKNTESGQRIQPGQALMAVVEPNIWVLANLKETQLAKVRVGQRVEVKIDSVPDHLFIGHVDSFQPGSGATFSLLPPDNATGNFTKIVQRIPIKIVFDPESLRGYEQRIIPGLSAQPKIELRNR
jgi:membrane fusion protein (multidrug efflux system)